MYICTYLSKCPRMRRPYDSKYQTYMFEHSLGIRIWSIFSGYFFKEIRSCDMTKNFPTVLLTYKTFSLFIKLRRNLINRKKSFCNVDPGSSFKRPTSYWSQWSRRVHGGLAEFLAVFLENFRSNPNFGTFFTTEKACIHFDTKCVGIHFGRFFHKRIWSPWITLSNFIQEPESHK
jgi:hypothetical protein